MTRYRLDQETAERLLSGAVDGSTGPVRPLVTLLTAVRPAAARDELPGESAAMSAYRAARATRATPVPDRAAADPAGDTGSPVDGNHPGPDHPPGLGRPPTTGDREDRRPPTHDP
ncbi:hypothetical protein ACN261_18535 [Micromonospora sp. WMMD723]|uniref:hypothetical protein n=1 Tax=unclassified Micromonospora TaxID=2617518 RepID=UPI003B930D2B